MLRRTIIITLGIVMAFAYASKISARVGLVTLPQRDSVRIRLDRDGNALVTEQRVVTVKEGENQLEFSWRKMNINLNTVQLTPSPKEGEVNVLSMSVPPSSVDSLLVWTVSSTASMELPVRITYLTRGINWQCDYIAIVGEGEKTLALKAIIKVANSTVEDYQDAFIELEVGQPIVQSLRSGEAKKLSIFQVAGIPIQKTYTSDPNKGGEVRVHYVFKNNVEHHLGSAMLLPGKVRLYRQSEEGSQTFLGEDRIDYIPRGEEIKLYIGNTRDIEVERKMMRRERENIRRDKNGNIVVYDTKEQYQITVKNHKSQPEQVIVIVHLRDYWKVEQSSQSYEKMDAGTLKLVPTVAGDGEEVIKLNVTGKNITEGFVIQQ